MVLFYNCRLRLAIVALVAAIAGLFPAVGHAGTRSQVGTGTTGTDDWYLYVLEEGTYVKFNGDTHEYVKNDDGSVKQFLCYTVVKAIKGLHKEGDTSSYSFGSLEMTNNQFFCIKKGEVVEKFERDGVKPQKYEVQHILTSMINDPKGISATVSPGSIFYCGIDDNDDHVALPYSTLVFKPGANSDGTLYMKKPVFLEYTSQTSPGIYNDVFHEELDTYDGETWFIGSAQFIANEHCTITYTTKHDVYTDHVSLNSNSFGVASEIKPYNGFTFDANYVCKLKVTYDDKSGHFMMTPTKLDVDNKYYLISLKKDGTKYNIIDSREFEHTGGKELDGTTYTYALPGNILMDTDTHFAISCFVPTNSVKQSELKTITAYGENVEISMATGVRNHCNFSEEFYGTMYIEPVTDDPHKFNAYFEKKEIRPADLNGSNLGAVKGYPLLDGLVSDPEKGLKLETGALDKDGNLTYRPILHQNPTFKNGEYTIDGKTVKLEYFENRMALTGKGCSVNRLAGGGLANVGTANTDLYNIISSALDKAGSITNGIGASLATAPLVSVRDKDHYYAKGTTAGFNVIAGSGTKVLSLSVIKMMSIGFYRDGHLMAVLPVDTKAGSAVELSLISISNNESSYDMTATAPCVFDEVAIFMAGGVKLNVGDNFQVKYAFVGNTPELTLGKNGLAAYNDAHPNDGIHVEEHSTTYDAAGIVDGDNFTGDETASTNIINTANLLLGGVGWARVCVDYDDPDKHIDQVFKKGDRVSFKIKGASVLELGIGTGNTITLYQRRFSGSKADGTYKVSYEKAEDMVLNATVLDLGVVKIEDDQIISMVAPCDFSGMKLTLNGGLVNLGATNVYYASVTPAPTVRHECDIKFPSDVYLHKDVKETYYWLEKADGTIVLDPEHKGSNPERTETIPTYKPEVPAGVTLTWSLVKNPDNSAAVVDESTGELTGLDKTGDYVLCYVVTDPTGKHDNCSGNITVHYMSEPDVDSGATLLGDSSTATLLKKETGSEYSYNKTVVKDGKEETVTVNRKVPAAAISVETHGASGGIIIGEEGAKDLDNIIDGQNTTYATIKPAVAIAENAFIIGIKSADGSNMIQPNGSTSTPATPQAAKKAESAATGTGSGVEIVDYNPVRVGFLVQRTVDGLDLSALDFYNIHVYKNGKEIYKHVVEQSTGVDLGLGDTEKGKVVRSSIVIPRDVLAENGGFDEFALWLSGVADIDLSEIRVYGAFVEEIDESDMSHLPSMCSNKTVLSDGSVYPKVTGGVADVASSIDNLSFINDYDPDFKTAMTVAPAVGVGEGQVIEVKLNETVPAGQQVGIIVDDATFALGATVGDWLKVRCLKDGQLVYENATDWGVLGAKVGSGDSQANKAALVFNPKGEFNELELEVAGIVNALDSQNFYGICTQGDANGDGVPDCIDNNLMYSREDEVRKPVSGIDNVETFSASGAIRIETWGDGTATVHSDFDGIDEVTVYDILGTCHSVISGNGNSDVTVNLPYGICLLKVELMGGQHKTFKVRR